MSRHDFPFSLADICQLEGVRIPNDGRSNYLTTCPRCGKNSLSLSFQKDNFRCFSPSCGIQGGLLQFYVYLEEKDGMSLSEAKNEIMERLYGISKAKTDEDRKKIKAIMDEKFKKANELRIPQSDLRCIQERDKTYSELLGLLTLAKDHEDNLLSRGLSRETIIERHYRTFPVSSFEEYPIKLMEEGLYVDGVPGFYKNDNEKWELRKLKRGFILPIISRNNLIQGFQIRKDDKLLATWEKKKSDGSYVLDSNKIRVMEHEKKFTWLSSKGLKNGTGVNGFVHYACDFILNEDGLFVPRLSPDKGILLTEGPLKGDIFHEKTSYPAICVPGVSCQFQLEQELVFLKSQGFDTIYNGYDMDYDVNQNVYQALKASYELIRSHGFQLKRLLWNPAAKGIDDYYASKEKK